MKICTSEIYFFCLLWNTLKTMKGFWRVFLLYKREFVPIKEIKTFVLIFITTTAILYGTTTRSSNLPTRWPELARDRSNNIQLQTNSRNSHESATHTTPQTLSVRLACNRDTTTANVYFDEQILRYAITPQECQYMLCIYYANAYNPIDN